MAPEMTETVAPAVAIRFVGSPDDGYEIQLENNDGLDDAAIHELLRQALDQLDTRETRARGMW
jgi:hypothetical protein